MKMKATEALSILEEAITTTGRRLQATSTWDGAPASEATGHLAMGLAALIAEARMLSPIAADQFMAEQPWLDRSREDTT